MALFKRYRLLAMTLTETVSVSVVWHTRGKNIQASLTASNVLVNGDKMGLSKNHNQLLCDAHHGLTLHALGLASI
jgi:hypothetical protein